MLWIQFLLPLRAGRGATLLSLSGDLATIPLMRQIAVAHDVTQATDHRQQRGIAYDARNRLWKMALTRSDKVIAISGSTKQDLVEHFGVPAASVHVIYEGYDASIFRPAPSGTVTSAHPYLLYAGTLAPNKNIRFLLDVYLALRKRSDVQLTLVGKQDPGHVDALVKELPAEARDCVHFAGFVSDAELASLMRGCTAFVFPSLYEGFGLAPVEAMACGAPVIASYGGSLREVVGDGGVVLSPTDREAWVTELTRVFEDREYRRELSRRALARSQAFSWDRAAEAYRELLDKPV
jgi:glycosyltransferase involved in cell wall biosynthesis